MRQLAKDGIKSLEVVCPGFVGDCLETLEEIAMEVRDAFLEDGGSQFHYIECLNDSAAWIQGMASVAMQHMGGWALEGASETERADSRTAALSMGAED